MKIKLLYICLALLLISNNAYSLGYGVKWSKSNQTAGFNSYYTDDGKYIVTFDENGWLKFFNRQNYHLDRVLSRPYIEGIEFDSQNNRYFLLKYDSLFIYNYINDSLIFSTKKFSGNDVNIFSITKDTIFYSYYNTYTVKFSTTIFRGYGFFDIFRKHDSLLKSEVLFSDYGQSASRFNLALSSNSKLLYVGDADTNKYIMDIQSGIKQNIIADSLGPNDNIVFSGDDKNLYIVNSNNIRILDIAKKVFSYQANNSCTFSTFLQNEKYPDLGFIDNKFLVNRYYTIDSSYSNKFDIDYNKFTVLVNHQHSSLFEYNFQN